MGALLDDVAVAHDEDDICVADGRETVGDDEARAALHQGIECLLNPDLGTGIDRGGRLVENEHRRKREHDARDTEQLLLSLREIAAILRDHCVISLRQTADKAVCMCFFSCPNDLLIRSIFTAHPDVVADRAASQPCILQYHTKCTPKRLALHIPDIRTSDADRSGIDIIKAHQQIDQRRLSTARRPDDCYHLALLYVQIKIFDQLFLRCIGECHMLQADMSHILCRKRLRRICIRNLRLLVNQLEHPTCACDCILKLCDDTRNFIERLRVLVCIRQKCRELSDGHHTAHRRKRSGQSDTCVDEAVYKARCRIRDRGEENGTQRILLQPPVDLVKAALHLFLLSIRLHDLLILDHFIDERRLLSPRRGLQLKHGIRALRDEVRHKQRDRCERDNDCRNACVY